MSTEIDPIDDDPRRRATIMALVILLAGLALSSTLWIQLYRNRPNDDGIVDIFAICLWCLAVAPYFIGWLSILTPKPNSAAAGMLVGLCLDTVVRLEALNSKDAYVGIMLIIWPFFLTVIILISALVLSIFERRKPRVPDEA